MKSSLSQGIRLEWGIKVNLKEVVKGMLLFTHVEQKEANGGTSKTEL